MVKIFKKLMSYFLMFEGIDHFIVSTIAIIGLVGHKDFHWYSWFTPMWDYVMGAGTLLAGVFMNKGGNHDAS